MTLEVVLGQLIGNRHIQTINEERDSKCVRHFLGDLGKLRECFLLGPVLIACWAIIGISGPVQMAR